MDSEEEMRWEWESIVDAVAHVQSRITHVEKGGRSTEGGNYSFRRIDDVIKALHPILADAGVVIVPRHQEILSQLQPVPGRKESWSSITIRVEYTIRARGCDQAMTVQGIGVGLDNGDKGPGKALSYAYKSAITQLFSIPTDDPAMDAEMTPEDDAWWGGWDTKAEHDRDRSLLIDASRELDDAWREILRPKLQDLGVVDVHGLWIDRITAKQANRWDEALQEIDRMKAEEPFDLDEDDETTKGENQ